MPTTPRPVVLMILDGFGMSLNKRGNPMQQAHCPFFHTLEQFYPFTTLQASGGAVGLPWGEAGNSEVGHLTLGAGRVIYHHLPRIISSIHDESFFSNTVFHEMIKHLQEKNTSLHIIGLVSSGSVHSYIDHLYALLELTKREGVARVFLHCITDGKDAPLQEARSFIRSLQERIALQYPAVTIASLVGRFFAMDRDGQWDRIKRAYELFVTGVGTPFQDPVALINQSYEHGIFDEFIEPAYCESDGRAIGRITDGDAIIFFNFREDSMREITEAFAAEIFSGFTRSRLNNLFVVTMTEYKKDFAGVSAAFPPLEIQWPLARVIAHAGKSQLHIAESEKYAHVTYFFNGGIETPFPGEERILVPSFSVPHFDEHPEMKAAEITRSIIARLDTFDFILGNLANADMVGHTGNYEASVKAIEVIDTELQLLSHAVLEKGGMMIITGDHGNIEQKINPVSGEPLTQHTLNPVPFYLVDEQLRRASPASDVEIQNHKKAIGGILTDVAPTVLELLDIKKPAEMTGKSLLPLLIIEGKDANETPQP